MERTFLMVKPDGVQRGLIGKIISRIEERGFKITGIKFLRLDEELARKHYAEHVNKPFFPGLATFIMSGPVVAIVVEGKNAVHAIRNMIGVTDPQKASLGTIRGDYALETGRNVVHASDSHESAKREIALYFKEEELISYRRIDEEWIYEH